MVASQRGLAPALSLGIPKFGFHTAMLVLGFTVHTHHDDASLQSGMRAFFWRLIHTNRAHTHGDIQELVPCRNLTSERSGFDLRMYICMCVGAQPVV